jgi:uncharacterized protein (DUF1015 family)
MSDLMPFRALRPAPAAAAAVAAVPYDVVSADEARALTAGNPLSFLHVTRAEIDLPAGTNPYDAAVYAQAVRNFEELKRQAPLLLDDEPALYAYRLRMGEHEQTGLAGTFSLDEYANDRIKKHEKTRQDKEDDRTRHIVELRAQTGIVFLAYRGTLAIDAIVARVCRGPAVYDFVAADGVGHTLWQVRGGDCDAIVEGFRALDALYIADGHHRAASAARARQTLGAGSGADRFLAVAFPDQQVRILPYNRVVKDLAGHTPEAFLAALAGRCGVEAGPNEPSRAGEVSMYLAGRWYTISLPSPPADAGPAERLDVEGLHRAVLAPLLQVGDPRTDKRIDFIGGIRGAGELERLVADGRAAVAFSMFPVGVGDLMSIADSGGIMPPKSTWFEPKLRDGLLVHLI